jgi:hypothetical protein
VASPTKTRPTAKEPIRTRLRAFQVASRWPSARPQLVQRLPLAGRPSGKPAAQPVAPPAAEPTDSALRATVRRRVQ